MVITHKKGGHLWRKSNLICNTSYQRVLQTSNQIYEIIAKESLEKEYWTKGNNSWKVNKPWQK